MLWEHADGGDDVPVGVIVARAGERAVCGKEAIGGVDAVIAGQVQATVAEVRIDGPAAGVDPVDGARNPTAAPQDVARVVVAMEEHLAPGRWWTDVHLDGALPHRRIAGRCRWAQLAAARLLEVVRPVIGDG